jgi:predicted extracellular nuclease
VTTASKVTGSPTDILDTDEMTGMVTLQGFYVQDPEGGSFVQGRYSGVLVTARAEALPGAVPPLGRRVRITGTYSEYSSSLDTEKQKQVQATLVEDLGSDQPIEPVEISSAASIATGGSDSAAYEGVLVKIPEVEVTETMVQVRGMDLRNSFRITAGLIVSGELYLYRNPDVGEQFTSIAGVLRLGTAPWDSGEYMLTPRFVGDVVPKNGAAAVTTIAGIQDPSSPDKPLETCSNPNGNMVLGTCPTAQLTRVVVTAVDAYVSRNLRAMFVQDPNDSDGRYSGVKIVYSPDRVGYVPAVGEYVDVTGEVITYRGGVQIQYPTVVRNGTDTLAMPPVLVMNSADLARNMPSTHVYEGALVKIENVTVTERCTEDDNQRDHGYWVVSGNALIGSAFDYDYNGDIRPSTVMCLTQEQEPTGLCSCEAMSLPNDQRMVGDTFQSITGVVDYAFGEFKIEPRSNDDLVR